MALWEAVQEAELLPSQHGCVFDPSHPVVRLK